EAAPQPTPDRVPERVPQARAVQRGPVLMTPPPSEDAMSDCKNKPESWSARDWVCLCPRNGESAKEVLGRRFINSWVQHAMARANDMADDPSVSEEQAEEFLRKLELDTSNGLMSWQNTQ